MPHEGALTKRGSSLAVRTRKFSRRTPAVLYFFPQPNWEPGAVSVSPDQECVEGSEESCSLIYGACHILLDTAIN